MPLPLAIAGLAALYFLAGYFGLQLAVPPGYATIVWPASGIALSALIMGGLRVAPGVFLGSLLVNAYVGGAFSPQGADAQAYVLAVSIATGSTAQALLAAALARRVFGVPIQFRSAGELAAFIALVGPVGCVIGASVGVASLHLSGVLPAEAVAGNWTTWWLGDLIGVLIFLPLGLVGPWRPWTVKWAGRAVGGLTVASLLAVIVPIGLTFYAWKTVSEAAYARNQAAFAALAEDNEQALRHRLDLYKHSLDGGVGLLQASDRVRRDEWLTYVDALNIKKALPGINGLGLIVPVDHDKINEFYEAARADGMIPTLIHPDTRAPANFIIKYIEPVAPNIQAVGLNIAFEDNRYSAAIHARDTGKPTITKRIFLVQDSTRSAGFLLLRPLYRSEAPTDTVAQRRAAFKGWVYAPFVGSRLLADLTVSQGTNLHLSIFDGPVADPEQLIYSSEEGGSSENGSAYKVQKVLRMMEQDWTIVWNSTPDFESSVESREASLVLGGGLALSLLLGVYMLSLARREDAIREMVSVKTRELAAREQENGALVDTALVAIVLLDRHGRTLAANRATLNILGHGAGDVEGMPLDRLLGLATGLTGPQLLDQLGRHSAADPKATISATRTDGTELDLDLQLNAWQTEAGDKRFTAIIRDVSAQRRMGRALEQAEERWSNALRGANIGVFDIDLRTGHFVVSDTWRTMLGFSHAEAGFPHSEWIERVHPDDLPMIAAAERACIEGRTERAVSEYRIRHTQGHWIWVRTDAIVTERDATGRGVRLVGTQADVSELKHAEAALRASEIRLRSAIINAPIGMGIMDPTCSWATVNDALCNLLGYKGAELLEEDFLNRICEEDRENVAQALERMLDNEIANFAAEVRFEHKDGHRVWGYLSTCLIRDADGQPEHFITQIVDVNDRKEMDRLKSEFISTVSHELRTPLTSIRGSLGLIEGTMSDKMPEGARKLISIAHKNSERLIALINDLLDLEKMTADKLLFTIKTEDLVKQVAHALDENQAYADQFGVTYVFEGPDSGVLVDIDPVRLQQILANLMSNAAKFSPPGGEVKLQVDVREGQARVSVTDNGPGIPAKFRANIFKPFSQADASATREKGGTGLGLHLARQMAERMQGRLDYSSVQGEGATFWIDLPLSVSGTLMAEAREGLPYALHVEDDGDFGAYIATALSEKLNVLTVSTLADARAVLDQRYYELVIIDIGLPDGNGLELLEAIPSEWRKPIVVLTAADVTISDPKVTKVIVKTKVPESEIISHIEEIADEMAARNICAAAG